MNPPRTELAPSIAICARRVGSSSIIHSSAIAASGSSSALKNPEDPFRNRPSFNIAALAAKHTAHTNGTARQTANARTSTREIHGTTGESTIAIGIPMNTRTVEIARTTFIISSPRNRMLATTAITMLTNSPTPRNPSPTPAPTPTASRFALDFVTLPEPSSPVLASLASATAAWNIHGQIGSSNAAPTVRASPSSADPPLPARPASQNLAIEIVATAPSAAPAIARTVRSVAATWEPAGA